MHKWYGFQEWYGLQHQKAKAGVRFMQIPVIYSFLAGHVAWDWCTHNQRQKTTRKQQRTIFYEV